MKNKFVYIIAALLLTALLLIQIEIRHQSDVQQIAALTGENATLAKQNNGLSQTVEGLRFVVERQEQDIAQLTNEIEQLKVQPPKVPETQKTNRSGDRLTSLGEYIVTAYCSCEKCCGEYAKNRPGGKVYGAAGVELTPGISVAGWLPLGAHIVIDDHEYIVQDRTAAWIREKYDGRIVDIYMGNDHQAAWDWGRQSLEVCKID